MRPFTRRQVPQYKTNRRTLLLSTFFMRLRVQNNELQHYIVEARQEPQMNCYESMSKQFTPATFIISTLCRNKDSL